MCSSHCHSPRTPLPTTQKQEYPAGRLICRWACLVSSCVRPRTSRSSIASSACRPRPLLVFRDLTSERRGEESSSFGSVAAAELRGFCGAVKSVVTQGQLTDGLQNFARLEDLIITRLATSREFRQFSVSPLQPRGPQKPQAISCKWHDQTAKHACTLCNILHF